MSEMTEKKGVVASLEELVESRSDASRIVRPPAGAARQALAGPYLSAFRGGGIEFDEVRAYQAGDDVRSIDWRVTARTGRPHSRVFREERERPVWLSVDMAPEMHFGTRRAFKSVVAARVAAMLGWSARDGGDRVGALVRSASGTRVHAPKGTYGRFFSLLTNLADASAEHSGAAADSFDATLQRLAARARSGCRAYVLSDFAELGDVGRACLSRLARQTDLTCLWIYDGLEAEPPPPGEYRVTNGREACRVVTSNRARREAWTHDFTARARALVEFCQSHRIALLPLRTDQDPLDVLVDPGFTPRLPLRRRVH